MVNNKHYLGKEIIVLSPLSDTISIASKIGKPFYSLYYLLSKNDIGYSSIYTYKGLESSIITIIDIDQFSSENAMSLFYTGITSTVDDLYILLHKDTRTNLFSNITSLSRGGKE